MPRYRCPQCAYALSKEKRMFFRKDLFHCRPHWGFQATSFAAGRPAAYGLNDLPQLKVYPELLSCSRAARGWSPLPTSKSSSR